MYSLLTELFPYNRSLTGDGVRKTLSRIAQEIPLIKTSVKSGTEVFDWVVPPEWNVTSAQIYDPDGTKIVDFKDNNLFLMSYSVSVNKVMSLEKLLEHIITDQTRPDTIPYSTSYYKDAWAFCLPFNMLKKFADGDYRVIIESTKMPGELIYGESFIDNGANKTVLISSYICHPSMANDSISGVVLAVELFKELRVRKNLKYNYHFLFVPETIGTICFLHKNKKNIKENNEYGLVATCVGDAGEFTYKRSRMPNSNINRVVEHIFQTMNLSHRVKNFSPLGSDERQYCSPGFNLDVGVITKSMYGEFPEYHTSADNLDFVSEEYLRDSLNMYMKVILSYEANCRYTRIQPYCEPQLGKYGLYREIGGAGEDNLEYIVQQRMWILNYADGKTDLLEIANLSGFDILSLKVVADELVKNCLIKEVAKEEVFYD
tara:strand:- start:353 stop:1645 length:1293 start_codon:yes stop_codon:yes gene_type:complete